MSMIIPSRERTLAQIEDFGKLTFTVTEDHLKLLPHMNIKLIGDGHFGHASQDAKRPYGNSNIEGDIHEILTGEGPYDFANDAWRYNAEDIKRYKWLHQEMATVLLIVAQNNGVELGEYISAKYFYEWTKA